LIERPIIVDEVFWALLGVAEFAVAW